MAIGSQTSEAEFISLLSQRGALSISDLVSALRVTPTAVRQRLNRLMATGLIERQEVAKPSRGRPSHRYSLTSKGRREAGTNFADLTLVLWKELRSIRDPQVRTGLLQRIAKAMAEAYSPQISGTTPAERMVSVSELMNDRDVAFKVETPPNSLPVLTAAACPYPELAEQDRGICAVEKILFSELVGSNVRLADCRLDGATCCRFETN